MPACAVPNAEGFLYVAKDVDVADCTGYVMVTASEYSFMMDYTQVTGAEISQSFGLGFSLVFVVGYLLTYGVKAALQLIRLI